MVGVGLSRMRAERDEGALWPGLLISFDIVYRCMRLAVPWLPAGNAVTLLFEATFPVESGGMGDGQAEGLSFFICAFICAKCRSYSHAAC